MLTSGTLLHAISCQVCLPGYRLATLSSNFFFSQEQQLIGSGGVVMTEYFKGNCYVHRSRILPTVRMRCFTTWRWKYNEYLDRRMLLTIPELAQSLTTVTHDEVPQSLTLYRLTMEWRSGSPGMVRTSPPSITWLASSLVSVH